MSSTELAVMSLQEITGYAKLFAESGMFKNGNFALSIAQCAVKIQAGAELGFPAYASIRGVHIINGQTAISAGLIAAKIKATPKYDYLPLEVKDKNFESRIEVFQNGKSIGIETFTMDDAKRAQLTSNPTWSKYPSNMLFSRNISNIAKKYFPDIFMGSVYTPDELDNKIQTDEDGNVINIQFEASPVIDHKKKVVETWVPTEQPPQKPPLPFQADDPITQKQIYAINSKCDELNVKRPDPFTMGEWTRAEGKDFWLGLQNVIPEVAKDNATAEEVLADPNVELDSEKMARLRMKIATHLMGKKDANGKKLIMPDMSKWKLEDAEHYWNKIDPTQQAQKEIVDAFFEEAK